MFFLECLNAPQTNFFSEIHRKAEMEARRKEEEARRLRQEEEDRKAALALQVNTLIFDGCDIQIKKKI